MKNIIYYSVIAITLTSLLCISCGREFNDNPDYEYNQVDSVFGDNSLLYSKVFRNQTAGTYLWFGLRNEIANFTKPKLSVSLKIDGTDNSYQIDLRGRLYEYNSNAEEITFRDITLGLFNSEEQKADLVCSLAKRQIDGCDDLQDETLREQCKRTYILKLKRIVVKDIGATLQIGEPYTYQNSTITLSVQVGQDLYLTN